MSKEKKVYNLLKTLDNIENNIEFNIFNEKKIKLNESQLSFVNVFKKSIYTLYTLTILFFLYYNFSYFFENSYQISIIRIIYLFSSLCSIILYWSIFDISFFFINKYYNKKYKKIKNKFKQKEKKHIVRLVENLSINDNIDLTRIVKERLDLYNEESPDIINRVIKQTSFNTENEVVNDFIKEVENYNKEME